MRRGQVTTMFSKKRAEPIQLPSPYVLSPSGKYEGNDGKWSTFFINVGDDAKNNSNGQNFRVLISTSSPATLVPQQTDWCSDPTPEECAANRGILSYEGRPSLGFDDEKSSTWKTAGVYTIPVPEWYNDTLQAEEPAAVWGVDNVGLGESSPQGFILAEQYVVKYTVANFYMGSFGLAVGSTGPPGALKPNFMDNMYGSAHRIASRSFGYTAGAYYRNNNNGVTGSLVLGGYDKSRLSDLGVSISMPSRQNNTLAVGVISILWKPDQDAEANTASFTKGGFPATIDSTLPYLILPDEVCDQFVTTFGLTLDEDVQLYTVNDSSHQQNLRLNPTLSFKISANTGGDSTDFTDITLPYSALDQQAGYPLFFNTTRYLPIKRSLNGRFVLGRTFLQEAYIVVDYEHQNFTVAPATFSDPMPDPSLVTIFDRSYTGLPTPPESGSGGGLSAGAIAGIVVGIVGAFIIVAIGAYLLWRKKRQTRNSKEPEENTEKPSEIDTTFAGTEIKYRRVSELTGSEAPHSPKDPAAGYYSVDQKSYPPISEMSPESTPAELYSPPPDGRNSPDYFTNGRYSVPLAELPGGDTISSMPSKNSDMKPMQKPPHSRSPSDNSLSTNIDEVLAKKAPEAGPDSEATRSAVEPGAPATAEEINKAKAGAQPEADNDAEEAGIERRPSHTRGLSDTTIQSDSTAVSQPTPEELERWARSVDGQSRPMSPS